MAEHADTHDRQADTLAEAVPYPTGHMVPLRVLVGVWAVLVILTGATVSVTWVDLGGSMNLYAALAIAVVKAVLVLLYFMHLRYDHPLNAMWFIFALFFVALFLAGTLTDTDQYQPQLIPGYAPAMSQQ